MSASGSESSAKISIEEVAEAKGADRMFLSPDGRWMALQFVLEAQPSLLVRIDRRGEQPPAVTRGLLGGPPLDDGAMFYVQQEAPDMRRVRASSPDDRRSHLRRLGSSERLVSRDGAYGARPVGEDRVLMFGGGEDGPVDLLLVNSRNGQVLATREPLAGPGPMVGSVIGNGCIHILFNPRWADPPRNDGLVIVTLSTDDLRELWRREGIDPEPMFTNPSLGTTAAGRTLLLVSDYSAKVVSFDAATGEPGPVLDIPVGFNVLDFVSEAKPREHALMLWTKRVRGIMRPHGWKLLAVRDDHIEVVADRPEELPPRAAVWDGQRVLLAPWANPRWEDLPGETWEEPFISYMKLLDDAAR